MAKFDFVVVGGGHNGLVAATLLALAGGRVALVESSGALGGLAGSSPVGPRWALGPAYSVGLFPLPLAKILGVDIDEWLLWTDPSWVVLEDGEKLFSWRLGRRELLGEFEAHGLRDAAARVIELLERWRDCAAPRILYSVDPPSLDEAASIGEMCDPELGDAIARPASSSLLSGLGRLKGLFTYPALETEPGYSTLYFNTGLGIWGQPRKLEGGVVRPLVEAALRAGVRVFRGRGVIVARGGRARSVVVGSRVLEASRAIVYSGNLACADKHIEGGGAEVEEIFRVARSLRSRSYGGPQRINIIVAGPVEPPAKGRGGVPLVEIWDSRFWGEASYPTLNSRRGSRRLGLVTFTGVIRDPGSAYDLLEALGVVDARVKVVELTPLVQEMVYCNPGGNPNHLPMTRNTILDRRPWKGWKGYKTPLEGLYHASASSHPGGQVTGIPGYNAVRRILSDMGLEVPEKLRIPLRSPLKTSMFTG